MESTDIVIIGAGPSGAVAAALLVQKGYQVVVLEREHFPRFSIGESLLPQCMAYLEEADMLNAVAAAGFQHKNGAAFHCDGATSEFDFRDKFTAGHGTTFQVKRAQFDKILADEAARQGADIRYGNTVTALELDDDSPTVHYQNEDGAKHSLTARFILDASGFGRVLPRLLKLDKPSDFPVRQSVFTHVQDNIHDPDYDRNKILICVHPKDRDIWYWLIPFADGTASVGVVAEKHYFEGFDDDNEAILRHFLNAEARLSDLLSDAKIIAPVRQISGYSASVSSLCGKGFALLGNAGEFLDPVFSSGVTIALHSASLAAKTLDKQLQGEAVDWDNDFVKPLQIGIETFKVYVTAWYDQSFQDVVFFPEKENTIKQMISSILAGYAWDTANPYVADAKRRLNVLVKLCRLL